MGSPCLALTRPARPSRAALGDLSRCPFPYRLPPLTSPLFWSPPGAAAAVPGARVPCRAGAGSHVPGSAAVPALPRLAPHPMAQRRAGGRGRLWADAGAAPNPSKQMLPVCHPLGDAVAQCRRRSASPPRLLSRERRKATVLAEHRPPASLTDFQRRPSFTRFAWCWHVSCHCPPMDLYSDPQPSLRCLPIPSHVRMDMPSECWYQEEPLPVSPPPSAFALPSGHQQVPEVPV